MGVGGVGNLIEISSELTVGFLRKVLAQRSCEVNANTLSITRCFNTPILIER